MFTLNSRVSLHFDIVYVAFLFYLISQEWLKIYSHRRYGKAVDQVEAAWKILHETIYNCTDGIAVSFFHKSLTDSY